MQDFSDLTAFIDRRGTELVTDSRAVALAFKKRHRDVLRVINAMRRSTHPEVTEHTERNFALSAYRDSTGREMPMYRMTAKGMTELTMGFTGEQSRIVRIRFVNAFEVVAERLAQAERTITGMLHDLERRELPSVIKGQIGSKLMNERRKEKPCFAVERSALMAKAQPGLFLN